MTDVGDGGGTLDTRTYLSMVAVAESAVSRNGETEPECEFDEDSDGKSVDDDKQLIRDEHTRARNELATDTDAWSQNGRSLEWVSMDGRCRSCCSTRV